MEITKKVEGWVIVFQDKHTKVQEVAIDFSRTKNGCIKNFMRDFEGVSWAYMKRVLKCKCVKGSITIVAYSL